jgi:hypothetical protein
MRQRMHVRNLDRRVHLLLDDRRYRKLADEAKREAIDSMPTDADYRRAAIADVLAAEPMPVPVDPADLRRDLDAGRDDRS